MEIEVEPGSIVLGLVLDIHSGRSPLYYLEKAFEHSDRALLFGQEIPPGYFNDDNVGRVMDQLYHAFHVVWVRNVSAKVLIRLA